jgi:hypothetical protein
MELTPEFWLAFAALILSLLFQAIALVAYLAKQSQIMKNHESLHIQHREMLGKHSELLGDHDRLLAVHSTILNKCP